MKHTKLPSGAFLVLSVGLFVLINKIAQLYSEHRYAPMALPALGVLLGVTTIWFIGKQIKLFKS